MVDWRLEEEASTFGHKRIAGVDEAGRGCLAGPVVSAAVVLPCSFDPGGIADSKKLSAKRREAIFERILNNATVGIGIVDAPDIDRINILQAALLSMEKAVGNLAVEPDYLLIDGPYTTSLKYPQRAVVRGDDLSVSIACASIVAKVTRDRIMVGYDRKYPAYGFAGNKGYPTKAHRDAILLVGPCPIHRRSFKTVVQQSLDRDVGISRSNTEEKDEKD